jgi:hypothetical protein
MMRSMSPAEVAALAGQDYALDVRFTVDGQDLSAWFIGATWYSGIDQPVDELRVTLGREDGTTSLAPLISDTIDLKDPVTLEVATATGALREVFRGHVFDIAAGGRRSRLELVCRDLGGHLLDTFIEEKRRYGVNPGEGDPVTLATVMQAILDDNNAGVALHVEGDPEAGVYDYRQERESVMDALQALAQTVGWIVRYEYDENDVARLTLRAPDRGATVPAWTFGPSDYKDVTRLDMDITDIRNAVRVEYLPPGAVQHVGVTAIDQASIDRYGRRALIIREGSDSPIRLESQALAMANPARDDLAHPHAEQEIETLFFWPVRLGDLYRFTANGIHYDTDQDWAVVGYRHSLSRTEHRTHITVRGKPAGGYLTWLGRQGREGREARVNVPVRLLSGRIDTELFYQYPPNPPLLLVALSMRAMVSEDTVAVRIRIEPDPLGVGAYYEADSFILAKYRGSGVDLQVVPGEHGFPRDERIYDITVTAYPIYVTPGGIASGDPLGPPATIRLPVVGLLPRPELPYHPATRDYVDEGVVVSETDPPPGWAPERAVALWLKVAADGAPEPPEPDAPTNFDLA